VRSAQTIDCVNHQLRELDVELLAVSWANPDAQCHQSIVSVLKKILDERKVTLLVWSEPLQSPLDYEKSDGSEA